MIRAAAARLVCVAGIALLAYMVWQVADMALAPVTSWRY